MARIQLHELNTKQNSETIETWKKYYSEQRIIKTLVPNKPEDDADFGEICEAFEITHKNTAFIVATPVTFLHLVDFKNNVPAAVAYFCFLKDGRVHAPKTSGLGVITYDEAFAAIAQRVTGVYINQLVPPAPTQELLSADATKKLEAQAAQFENNIQEWMDKIKELPAVHKVARKEEPTSPDDLVSIEVLMAFPGPKPADKDASPALGFYNLELGNTFRRVDHEEGEPSKVYDSWFDKTVGKESCVSWEDLYKALVMLSETYTTISKTPQKAKKK